MGTLSQKLAVFIRSMQRLMIYYLSTLVLVMHLNVVEETIQLTNLLIM